MNIDMHKSLKVMILTGSLLLSGVIVSACGGGGGSTESAGIGGTGITVGRGYVQGEVTQFGSIYVNGNRFDIDSSNFTVDGNNFVGQAGQDKLALGMVIQLRVETENGVFTDQASDIVYDDEVQGPVAGLPALIPGETQRMFTVFGQTITIDDTSTLFRGAPLNPDFGFDTIIDGDVVEISGFRTSPNDVIATYVEWKEKLVNDSEVELRGTVSGTVGAYVPGTPEFMLDGILVTFDPITTDIEVSGGLAEGVYVEVKGAYQTLGPSVQASKIEQEDENLGDELDDVSLQGIISKYNGNDEFEIDGLPVDASGATELSPTNVLSLLDEGVEIEVEGDIVGGRLIADEVELREGETELRTTVSSIALPNRFQVEYRDQPLGPVLGTIWINTDGQTLFEDKDDSAGKTPVENFSIDLLEEGNFVKIKGIAESGEVSAQIVKRLDPDDSSKLQGAVEAFNSNQFPDTSITILGITYPIDENAEYEDGSSSRTLFFSTLKAGDIVELEDDEPADADADEVKLDD